MPAAAMFPKMVAHNRASVPGCVLHGARLCAGWLGCVEGHPWFNKGVGWIMDSSSPSVFPFVWPSGPLSARPSVCRRLGFRRVIPFYFRIFAILAVDKSQFIFSYGIIVCNISYFSGLFACVEDNRCSEDDFALPSHTDCHAMEACDTEQYRMTGLCYRNNTRCRYIQLFCLHDQLPTV